MIPSRSPVGTRALGRATNHAPLLIPVRYGRLSYPDGIRPVLQEVPAHFDIAGLDVAGPYSLHTEYSAGDREMDSPALMGLDTIRSSVRRGLPLLWQSVEWAREFAAFVVALVGANPAPTVIEVHPPFRSSCPTNDAFLDRYEVFEGAILAAFPEAEIVIENRHGSRNGGRFLVSTAEDLVALGEEIAIRGLRLGIALDVPQVMNADLGRPPYRYGDLSDLVGRLRPVSQGIETIHLWGRKGISAHVGDLDDLVGGDAEVKAELLSALHDLLADGRPRYLVPEVNSSEAHLHAIVRDLVEAGFEFTDR